MAILWKSNFCPLIAKTILWWINAAQSVSVPNCLPSFVHKLSENFACSHKSYHQPLYLQVSILQLHFLLSAVSNPTVAGNLSRWWSKSPSWRVSVSTLVTLLLPKHMCDIGMRKFMMGKKKKNWPWHVHRPIILLQDRWRYVRKETGGFWGNESVNDTDHNPSW